MFVLKKFLVTIIFLLIISPVFADVFEHPKKLEDITKELPALESVRCKFSQEKYLPQSGVTLKSSGDFVFEKNKGVTFYTTYPITSTTSYTSKEYRQINSVITAISSGAYSKLEKDFRFYFEKNNGIWTLGLAPQKDSKVANYLKSIEIEGKSDISRIVIITKDLTKTSIRFTK